MSAPINRRAVDSSTMRAGFETLIEEMRASLKRYTPEQIAKSRILSHRQRRLDFYREMVSSFVYQQGNSIRKAKRKTYLLGVGCSCGYIVRITRKWLDVAAPVCPNPDCANRGKPLQEFGSLPADIRTDLEKEKDAALLLEEMQVEHDRERAEEKNIGTALDFVRPEDDTWLKGKSK